MLVAIHCFHIKVVHTLINKLLGVSSSHYGRMEEAASPLHVQGRAEKKQFGKKIVSITLSRIHI